MYVHVALYIILCFRHGLDSNVLRFIAKLRAEVQSNDPERLFIISYHLSDDTIAVFEPPMRNSGKLSHN